MVTFYFLAFITVHLLNSPEGSMFVLQFVTETFMLNIDMLWISNMVEQGYLAVLRWDSWSKSNIGIGRPSAPIPWLTWTRLAPKARPFDNFKSQSILKASRIYFSGESEIVQKKNP